MERRNAYDYLLQLREEMEGKREKRPYSNPLDDAETDANGVKVS